MCIYIYCAYDKLCNNFNKIFQMQIKKNISNYYWLSKILIETVECYNSYFYNNNPYKWHYFYHGITANMLYEFDGLFILSFNGPISTSGFVDVPTIFSGNNGIILELSKYNITTMTYFNCSWISPYSAEQEMLFFGGGNNLLLQSVNIRLLEINVDCGDYIKAIRNFYCFLNNNINDIIPCMNMDNNNEEMIINELIDQYLGIQNNQFPKYINNIFANICKKCKQIHINIDNMYEYYESFISIFWSDIDNLLRFDKM
eukprot:113580_1